MDGVPEIQKTMLLLLLGVGLFFHHGVGVEGTRVLSMEEDLELEEELKVLNKPAVKTIQLQEGGDIFDCVDIYKQPAFDHPLLKDHKIQMQPSSYPLDKLKINTTRHVKSFELPKILCPPGTVPIRRVTKEDLIRIKARSKHEANHTRRNYASKTEFTFWHTTLNTKEGVYYGAKAHINVWSLKIDPGEWSSAQIFVRSGFSGTDHTLMNAVEAGWRIEPNLFGDSQTRFFIYWTGDGYVNTGCYNLFCPGFVQTSNIVGLGAPVRPLSIYGGGQQTELRLIIYKEPVTHHWWLLIHDNQFVGYWPNTLFNSLRGSASEVFWGGNAGSPPYPAISISPPMGSGYFSSEGFKNAAYVDNVMLVDNNNTLYDPNDDGVRESIGPGLVAQVAHCYTLLNDGYVNPNDRYRFFYGGPGGCLS